MRKIGILVFFLFGLPCACNQTKFASNGNQKKLEQSEPPKEEPKVPEPAACDLSKDFVNLKFPDNIQKCIDAGNIYDFYRNACSPIRKATGFDCSFAGVKSRAGGLSLDYSGIDQAIADSAKLIGCGEKREGLTMVTEWWHPDKSSPNPGNNCSFSPGMIITVTCFQKENGDGTVVDAPTPEARREIIKRCLEL